MVHSLYQSLNNLETIYADRIGIRYYDEAKGGVVEVPFRQYAADLRRFVAFLRSALFIKYNDMDLPGSAVVFCHDLLILCTNRTV